MPQELSVEQRECLAYLDQWKDCEARAGQAFIQAMAVANQQAAIMRKAWERVPDVYRSHVLKWPE